MKPYAHIDTIFHRNPETKNKTLLEGVWSQPAFEYLKDNRWIFTEKIDGTNIRVIYTGSDIIFNGKTDNAQIPATLVKRLFELFPVGKFMDLDYPSMTLYGEGYGKGIQSGGNYIKDGVDFILFDVWIDGWWLERNNVEDTAQKLGIKVVPVIGIGTLMEGYEKTRAGFKSEIADCMAEGLVMRPFVSLHNRKGSRILTKIKHKDFKV
jgi:ATP-dependent RNA circularization protein (DNA/RNA ligase family)